MEKRNILSKTINFIPSFQSPQKYPDSNISILETNLWIESGW